MAKASFFFLVQKLTLFTQHFDNAHPSKCANALLRIHLRLVVVVLNTKWKKQTTRQRIQACTLRR